jgi:hypothetical protein
MKLIMAHPDGDFVIEYGDQLLKIAIWGDNVDNDDSMEIRLTPLGLVELGNRLIQCGLEDLLPKTPIAHPRTTG